MKLFLHSMALIGSLALVLSPARAAPIDFPVKPFQARYEVFGSGFSIGEAVMTLTASGPDAYQMSSEVRPNGLASLLVSGQIDEKVSGEIRDGGIRPTQYERQLDTPKKNKPCDCISIGRRGKFERATINNKRL